MTDIIIYGYDVFKDTTRYNRAVAGEMNLNILYQGVNNSGNPIFKEKIDNLNQL